MFLGKLNKIDSPVKLSFNVHKEGNSEVPALEKAGNPFAAEEMLIRWDQLYLSGVAISFSLSDLCFLDSIRLTLSEKCHATKITVFDEKDNQLLATYSGETGKVIGGQEIAIVVGYKLNSARIVIDAPFSDVGLTSIDLWGAYGEDMPLFPTPLKSSLNGKRIPVAAFTAYKADCKEGQRAGEVLAEKLCELTGISLKSCSCGNIVFAKDDAIVPCGYKLEIADERITLSASGLRGFVIAVETLLKSLDNGTIPVGTIEDEPRFDFRGVHIFIPPVEEFAFAKRLIKYVISPMGYNYVILEFAGGMRFESHPEITEAVLHAKQMAREGKWPKFPHGEVGGDGVVDKADVAAYIDYIRSFGIDVIPEIQSLGHVQYITIAHPDIAEREDSIPTAIDQRFADDNVDKFFAHCYCPSNEKSYQILFDLMDEIIEVARPTEYVHAGHDEVYQIGVCPVCRDKDPADLYYNDVMRIHDHLAAKGLKMMIWSDMLQNSSAYKTVPAVDRLPRDIVMMDFIWYFHFDKDIEVSLSERGYQILIGNLYSSHFPRYEKRVKNPAIHGGELSFWTRVTEEILGREGKIYDLLYTAEMLWNGDYNSALRFSYDRILRCLMPALREKLGNRKLPSLNANCKAIDVYAKSGAPDPEIDQVGLDSIAVNRKCDSIVFSHTVQKELTRIPWVPLEKIGEYQVTFEDGSVESVPVSYAGNIGYWNRRQAQPLPQAYYRHNGYIGTYFADTTESRLRDGRVVSIYHYEWIVPKDVAIASIRYVQEQGAKSNIVVYKVEAISAR